MRAVRLPPIDVEAYTPAAITAVRRSSGWPGLFLQERHGTAGRVRYAGGPRQHLVYCVLEAFRSEIKVEEASRTISYRPGEIRFTPASHSVSFRWACDVKVLVLGLEPWFLEGIAAELGVEAAFSATLNFRKLPATHPISTLLRQLSRELQPAAGGALVAEGLGRTVGVELLREFAPVPPVKPAESAPPRAVLRAVALMRERLAGSLSLEEMGAAAGLSPFHFARLFKTATGHPPHEYLVRLRVDRAQELIARHGRSITLAAIAQESGFSDQSHMARHFRRVLGVTPGEYAEARR